MTELSKRKTAKTKAKKEAKKGKWKEEYRGGIKLN